MLACLASSAAAVSTHLAASAADAAEADASVSLAPVAFGEPRRLPIAAVALPRGRALDLLVPAQRHRTTDHLAALRLAHRRRRRDRRRRRRRRLLLRAAVAAGDHCGGAAPATPNALASATASAAAAFWRCISR